LNAVFSFLVYWALPLLKIDIDSKPFLLDQQPLLRAIVAGFGYLVIARTSLLDIKTKTGEHIGVGFDAIYNGVAKYILNFHALQLKKKVREDFKAVQGTAPTAFLGAMKVLIGQASTPEEGKVLADALIYARGMNAHDYCFYLYKFIRSQSTNAKDARDQIEHQRNVLATDATRTAALQAELYWLFPSNPGPPP
jgi:hypothetical protein